MKNSRFFVCLVLLTLVGSVALFAFPQAERAAQVPQEEEGDVDIQGDYETVTVGGGCFWCVEAVYEPIEGILQARSGYAGGAVKNPTYNQVTSGQTGHAEVVQLYYDPEKINYEQILKLFFKAHDPTTRNRQGYDVGSQYRSIILTHSNEQQTIAEKAIAIAQKDWDRPIVTEIKPLEAFYEAEGYHQDFYANNPTYGYCTAIIRPKLEKLGLEGIDQIEVLDLKL